MNEFDLTQLEFIKATVADIPTLTEVMTLSFNDDAQRFQGQPEGGPDGYNDGRFFQRWMRTGECWKIVLKDRVIGAFLIFQDYQQKGSNVLGTIFLDPEFQNQGIGTYTMEHIHNTFPAKRWMLDTPEWHTRNHSFYEKLGYQKIGEQKEPHAGFMLRIYQKNIEWSASAKAM